MCLDVPFRCEGAERRSTMGLLDYVFFAPFRCEGTERRSTMGLVEQSGEQHQLWVHPSHFRQLLSESCVLRVSLKVSVTRKPWAYGKVIHHLSNDKAVKII